MPLLTPDNYLPEEDMGPSFEWEDGWWKGRTREQGYVLRGTSEGIGKERARIRASQAEVIAEMKLVSTGNVAAPADREVRELVRRWLVRLEEATSND